MRAKRNRGSQPDVFRTEYENYQLSVISCGTCNRNEPSYIQLINFPQDWIFFCWIYCIKVYKFLNTEIPNITLWIFFELTYSLLNYLSKTRCTNGVSANYYGSLAFVGSFLRIFLWVFKYFWTGGNSFVPELSDRDQPRVF